MGAVSWSEDAAAPAGACATPWPIACSSRHAGHRPWAVSGPIGVRHRLQNVGSPAAGIVAVMVAAGPRRPALKRPAALWAAGVPPRLLPKLSADHTRSA